MESVGGLTKMPPLPRSREEAQREFHRIMQGAAITQRVMGQHLMTAGLSTDPVKQAEAMDRAISVAESQLLQFRRAREAIGLASPGFQLPPPPPSLLRKPGAATTRPIPKRI